MASVPANAGARDGVPPFGPDEDAPTWQDVTEGAYMLTRCVATGGTAAAAVAPGLTIPIVGEITTGAAFSIGCGFSIAPTFRNDLTGDNAPASGMGRNREHPRLVGSGRRGHRPSN